MGNTAAAEIDLSVGTVGDAYDNALAECVIGLFKTEGINQIGTWKSMREVEWETLKWIDWYNNRRLLGPIGYFPPAEARQAFHANLNTLNMVARSLNKSPSVNQGRFSKPMMILSDNGTKFTSDRVLAFADKRRVDWHCSAP